MVLFKGILSSRIKQISASLHLSAERYWNLDLSLSLFLDASLFLDGTWIYFGSMARIFIFGWNLDLFWVYDPYLYFWMEPGFILGLWPVSLFLDGTWIYFGFMARIYILG